MNYSDIITPIVTFFSGTAVQALINFRLNRKQLGNNIAVEEFKGVESVVESSIMRIQDMMAKYEVLQEKWIEVSNELSKERLSSNNYRKALTQLLNDCNCDEKTKERIIREFQL